MIFIDHIAALFETIATKVDEIADKVDGVPLIGDYLGLQFYFIASRIENLVNNFEEFSDWCDTIGDIIGGEVGKFLNLLNVLRNEFIDIFNALPSFDELLKHLEERFEILTKTPEQLSEWIKDYLPYIPTPETIIAWVSEAFEVILDILFEERD